MKKHKFKNLHKKLIRFKKEALLSFQKKHPKILPYLEEKKLLLPKIKEHSVQFLAGATLVSSLFLGQAHPTEPMLLEKPAEERLRLGLVTSQEIKKIISEKISGLVPGSIGKLTGGSKDKICQLLKDILGVEACINLHGNELNFSYGWIGYEQHLKRYPGDDLSQHDDELVAGIAPGLSAWGYFAPSKSEMTEEFYQMEKYYVAVQTLYLPDWCTKTKELYEWYKHRKVVVVNPENGTACIGVVADAGPANWTGKQFGGSPEIMKVLDLHLGPRKGKVVLLFVDDPDSNIPLGPIDFNIKSGAPKIA